MQGRIQEPGILQDAVQLAFRQRSNITKPDWRSRESRMVRYTSTHAYIPALQALPRQFPSQLHPGPDVWLIRVPQRSYTIRLISRIASPAISGRNRSFRPSPSGVKASGIRRCTDDRIRVTESTEVQPPEPVMRTVYTPALLPVRKDVVSPVFHKYAA